MTNRRSFINSAAAGVFAAAMLAFPLAASAQGTAPSTGQPKHTADEIAKAKPSGTIEVSAEQLRLLLGGASGKGVLNYQGKQYPFTIKAATVGGVGYTKVTATGDVYFLDKLDDFAGTYSAATIGAALGGGVGGSQYENNKGVFISVKSKTEGVALNLGLGGVQVQLAK
jgi:hypothetical protein